MAKLSTQEIIDAIKEMKILEVKELVDAMKEEFGVDPSAVAVAAAPAAGADDRHRCQRVHPQRDAARPRVSGAAKIPAAGRKLRHRLAKPAKRVRQPSRTHSDDHQLHHAAPSQLC